MELAQQKARELLAKGAPVDIPELRTILERVVDYQAADDNGRTLLMCAVLSRDAAAVEVVRLLGFHAGGHSVEERMRRLSVRAGDPESRDRSGMSALDYAQQVGDQNLLAALQGNRLASRDRDPPRSYSVEVTLSGMIRVETCGSVSEDEIEDLLADPDSYEFEDYRDMYFLQALLLDQGSEQNGTIRVVVEPSSEDNQNPDSLCELRLTDNEPQRLESWCEVRDDAPPRPHCGIFEPDVIDEIDRETYDQPFFRRGGLYTGCLTATFTLSEPFDPSRLVLSRFLFPLMDVEGICVDSYRLSDGTLLEPDEVEAALEPWLIDSSYECHD